jgi:hypothetical protein
MPIINGIAHSEGTVGTAESAGNALCAVCERGQYALPVTFVTLETDDEGTLRNVTTTGGICTPCPAERYASDEGTRANVGQPHSLQCMPCPIGSTTQGVAGSVLCRCIAGRYADGAKLESFGGGGSGGGGGGGTMSSKPTPAPPAFRFRRRLSESQASAATCKICPLGRSKASAEAAYTAENGEHTCSACPAGTRGVNATVNATVEVAECRLCTAGRSQPAPAQTTCSACDSGQYTNTSGAVRCSNCEVGNFQSEPGEAACLPCARGRSQPETGQVLCRACALGQYAVAECSNECLDCEAGHYQSKLGEAACLSCARGRSQPAAGQVLCRACALGQYAGAEGSAECPDCEAGQYQGNRSATECVPCPPGTTAAAAGAAFCLLPAKGAFVSSSGGTSGSGGSGGGGGGGGDGVCPKGFFCDEGIKNPCPAGKLCGNEGLSTPEECPLGSICPKLDPSDPDSPTIEIPCPPVDGKKEGACAAPCSNGQLPAGYYVAGGKLLAGRGAGVTIARCPTDACIGTVGKGGSEGFATLCKEGTGGVLCAECEPHWVRAGKNCVQCPADGSALVKTAAMFLALLVLCVIVTKKALKTDSPRDEPSTVASLKILANGMWMTTILGGFGITWSKALLTVFMISGSLSGSMTYHAFVQCALGFDFHQRYRAVFLLPLACLVAPALVVGTVSAARRCCPSRATAALPPAARRLLWGVSPPQLARTASLALLYLMHPIMAQEALRVLVTVDVFGTRYAAADYGVLADSDAYGLTARLARLSLATVVPLLPAFVFGLLWCKRARLEENEVKKQLFFFYGNFKPHLWWWDAAVVMPRKTLFGAIIVLMDGYTVSAQLYAGLWLCSLALLLQLIFRPYVNETQDRMETFSLSMLVGALLASLPLAAGSERVDSVSRRASEWVVCVLLVLMMAGLLAVFTRELTGQVKGAVMKKLGKGGGAGTAEESDDDQEVGKGEEEGGGAVVVGGEKAKARPSQLETYQTSSGRFGAVNPMQTAARLHGGGGGGDELAAAKAMHQVVPTDVGAREKMRQQASVRNVGKSGHI